MPTISQLVRKPRLARHVKSKVPALGSSPKREGFVLVFIQLHQKNQIQLYVKWLEFA